jgi:hypothetical protein
MNLSLSLPLVEYGKKEDDDELGLLSFAKH